MSRGPLRRLIGALGLGALVPTSLMLTGGSITVTDAALRAGATLLGALVVGRLADRSLGRLIVAYEQSQDAAAPPGDASASHTPDDTAQTSDMPRRRINDR